MFYGYTENACSSVCVCLCVKRYSLSTYQCDNNSWLLLYQRGVIKENSIEIDLKNCWLKFLMKYSRQPKMVSIPFLYHPPLNLISCYQNRHNNAIKDYHSHKLLNLCKVNFAHIRHTVTPMTIVYDKIDI